MPSSLRRDLEMGTKLQGGAGQFVASQTAIEAEASKLHRNHLPHCRLLAGGHGLGFQLIDNAFRQSLESYPSRAGMGVYNTPRC